MRHSMEVVVYDFLDKKKLHRMEGRRGVELLATLASSLGYKDPMYFGQLSSTVSIGDLIAFFEDNSGAVEAVVNWVGRQNSTEWREALEAEIGPDDDDENGDDPDDENGDDPDEEELFINGIPSRL